MPAIRVTPSAGAETSTGGPVIGGVEFRRPTARTETAEALRQVVELGNGETRAYDRGVRPVYTFTWGSLTEDEVEQLKAATVPAYVPLSVVAGNPPVDVSTEDGVSAEAIAGTFPVRYSASVTLRARKPR